MGAFIGVIGVIGDIGFIPDIGFMGSIPASCDERVGRSFFARNEIIYLFTPRRRCSASAGSTLSAQSTTNRENDVHANSLMLIPRFALNSPQDELASLCAVDGARRGKS